MNTALMLLEDGQRDGLLRRDVPALALLTMVLGSLNYAHIVRPTFERAFADPLLRQESDWMQDMAAQLLRLLQAASFWTLPLHNPLPASLLRIRRCHSHRIQA